MILMTYLVHQHLKTITHFYWLIRTTHGWPKNILCQNSYHKKILHCFHVSPKLSDLLQLQKTHFLCYLYIVQGRSLTSHFQPKFIVHHERYINLSIILTATRRQRLLHCLPETDPLNTNLAHFYRYLHSRQCCTTIIKRQIYTSGVMLLLKWPSLITCRCVGPPK